MVNTVLGPREASQLGRVLMHEHVFILTPELAADYPEEIGWDESAKAAEAIASLGELKAAGIDTIVDLTVMGMGRDVARLEQISQASGVQIVVATGLYTFDALPRYLQIAGPGTLLGGMDPMVRMFLKDIEVGIAGTGIRAGILKCASDRPGITDGVRRVFVAAAEAHRRTGVPISTHSSSEVGGGPAQQDLLASCGVDLSRVVIGHSGETTDLDYLQSIADRGSYLGMDRFGMDRGRWPVNFDQRVETVAELCRRGYAAQVVLSHDAHVFMDWRPDQLMPGTSADVPDWHFTHISTKVLPALRERGVSEEQIDQMVRINPAAILQPCLPY
jgi:phosphotriesterase-related protein